MAEEAIQATEVQKTDVVEKVEVEQKPTIAETMGDKKPEAKEDRTVPEAAFLDLKNANKELKRDLKDLKTLIENGGAKTEVSEDIDEIAKEHNIDAKFLKQLATSIRKDAERDVETKVSDRLKPLEAKDRADKLDKVFNVNFEAAMAEMPEFASIVNPTVIKTLSLDPANGNKTFAQLIEDTYGKAVPGKRTLETTKPGGGRVPEGVDFDKARKDSKYFEEIMANPTMKKEYNDTLIDRIKDSI